MIRVALADDQELVRAGFAERSTAEDDIEVVGEAPTAEEAVQVAPAPCRTWLLMDIGLPRARRPSSATRRIAANDGLSAVHVVILTTFELDEYVFEGLRAGAAGSCEGHRRGRAGPGGPGVADGESLLSPRSPAPDIRVRRAHPGGTQPGRGWTT